MKKEVTSKAVRVGKSVIAGNLLKIAHLVHQCEMPTSFSLYLGSSE